MASETDLLNDALGQIGALPITSIDDGSTNANYCLQFYPTLRDARLSSHHWNFALTWVSLAPDVTPPVAGHAYAYTLPGDCLKVVNYGGSLPTTPSTPVSYVDPYIRIAVHYKIEGRTLVSNDGQVYIQYLRRITNPAEWQPMFYQGMAAELASKLASAITKDQKMPMTLLEKANHYFAMAMAIDGQEGSIEPYVVDDLIRGR